MHSLDHMPFCSQCDVLAHTLPLHFSCSVAILTQRTLLVLNTLSYAAGAASFAQLPVDRGFLLLLPQAASAAFASLPQAASAAAGMAAAGFAQYITAGLHITSGGLLNLEARRGFIASLYDDSWNIRFSERTDTEHDIVATLDDVNVISA
eukprot:4984697-Amphidinium_carterae.2